MKAEALAELDAEDSDADDCYISRPNASLTPPKGFDYKHPVLCAAHVHGIADPAMYGNHRSYNSREVFAIQADRRNALHTLAYERAKIRADCAARNIKTSEDAERAYVRIAAARADVVSQDIALQACDFK